MTITPALLTAIMPLLPKERADKFAAPLDATLIEFKILSLSNISAFLAQVAHESGELARTRENLNYSAARLRKIWPSRFPDDQVAIQYARKPIAIANKVYSNRLGNGDEASGDGWKYRGGGLIQITGRAAYTGCGKILGVDLINRPETIEFPSIACRSAGWFWNWRNLTPVADRGDFIQLTRLINGSTFGIEQRREYWARAKAALEP